MTRKTYIFATILVSMGLLLASIGPVVATDELWVQTYGDAEYQEFDGMVALADGGFAMAGGYLELGEEYLDMWLVRTDSTGATIWEEKYTDPTHLAELAYAMIEVSTGGFLLAGQADGGTSWIVRTDTGGAMAWNQTFEIPGGSHPKSIFECSDGGFVFAGGEGSNAFLMKTDSDGTHLWNQTFVTASAGEFEGNEIRDVIETSVGDFVMTGKTSALGAFEDDLWLLKTNENGVELWNKTYGDSEWDWGQAVIEVSSGGYAIVGTNFTEDGIYAWLLRVDSNGDEIWSQNYFEPVGESSSQSEGRDVIECSDGGFAIAGVTTLNGEGNNDILLLRTDSNGGYAWHKTYGGVYDDYGKIIAELGDGGFAVAGDIRNDASGEQQNGILVVFEDSAPVGPPPDLTLILIGAGAVVVVVIVLVLMRKRK
ncbi:MAG: hypothetical protein EAX95_12495 [Candidatus Thorarchaeota archaeon]|nr:hypothetical protein [Candidatus Thorarchaeota archaeon]